MYSFPGNTIELYGTTIVPFFDPPHLIKGIEE